MSQQQSLVAADDSQSIRDRLCGSVFARTVIDSLTHMNGVAMQPKDANDHQVATFNAYTRSIIDICCSDVTKNFTFSAQDNEWEGAWKQLADVPYAGDPTQKLNLDLHPSNTGEAVTAQAEPRGIAGALRSAHWREAMTRAVIIGNVCMMAQLFLETCPGDWTRGHHPAIRTMLEKAVRHGVEPEKRDVRPHIDIADFIKYRWQLAEMADSFVQDYELRKPDGETCMFWNDSLWEGPAESTIPGFGVRFDRAYSRLVHKEFKPKPMRSQGPSFNRFTRYMAAAVALTDLSQEKYDRVLQSLVCRVDKYKELYKKLCVEDTGVHQKGREWHEAIGR